MSTMIMMAAKEPPTIAPTLGPTPPNKQKSRKIKLQNQIRADIVCSQRSYIKRLK